MNQGKIFESQWQKSVPDYALLCRLPDSAQSFGNSSNLRFSRKNPFDFILWDSKCRLLYALELKTVKGKSITFERTNDDNGDIHYHQIKGLEEWDSYENTICGFVIEFRELEKTIFIKVSDFNKLIESLSKKSFNFNDLVKFGIEYILIDQKKARKRYTYNIDGFLLKSLDNFISQKKKDVGGMNNG